MFNLNIILIITLIILALSKKKHIYNFALGGSLLLINMTLQLDYSEILILQGLLVTNLPYKKTIKRNIVLFLKRTMFSRSLSCINKVYHNVNQPLQPLTPTRLKTTVSLSNFFKDNNRQLNYQRNVEQTANIFFNKDFVTRLKNMSINEQNQAVTDLVVKSHLESEEIITTANIIAILIPRFSRPKGEIINAFINNGIFLDTNVNGNLNQHAGLPFVRELDIFSKLNVKQITKKCIMDERSPSSLSLQKTKQINCDAEFSFMYENQLFNWAMDAKHGNIIVYNATTVLPAYLDVKNLMFTGILNDPLPVKNYIYERIMQFNIFEKKINDTPAQVTKYIEEMTHWLKIDADLKLKFKVLDEMSLNLIGMLEQNGIHGYNPSFLVILPPIKPPINIEENIISRFPNGFDNNVNKRAMIYEILKKRNQELLDNMQNTSGTILKDPFAYIQKLQINIPWGDVL